MQGAWTKTPDTKSHSLLPKKNFFLRMKFASASFPQAECFERRISSLFVCIVVTPSSLFLLRSVDSTQTIRPSATQQLLATLASAMRDFTGYR